jgi:hypothetical protein
MIPQKTGTQSSLECGSLLPLCGRSAERLKSGSKLPHSKELIRKDYGVKFILMK